MKQLLVLISISLFMAFTPLSEDWKTIDVVEKVKLSMPSEPLPVDSKGGPQEIKKCIMTDSTELALILLDFTKLGVTEEMLEGLKDTEDFKEQIKGGFVANGGEIKSESEGKYADKHLYFQFNLEVPKDDKKVSNITRIVFYKHYAIMLSYIPGKQGNDKALMDKFYNSLSISE